MDDHLQARKSHKQSEPTIFTSTRPLGDRSGPAGCDRLHGEVAVDQEFRLTVLQGPCHATTVRRRLRAVLHALANLPSAKCPQRHAPMRKIASRWAHVEAALVLGELLLRQIGLQARFADFFPERARGNQPCQPGFATPPLSVGFQTVVQTPQSPRPSLGTGSAAARCRAGFLHVRSG